MSLQFDGIDIANLESVDSNKSPKLCLIKLSNRQYESVNSNSISGRHGISHYSSEAVLTIAT